MGKADLGSTELPHPTSGQSCECQGLGHRDQNPPTENSGSKENVKRPKPRYGTGPRLCALSSTQPPHISLRGPTRTPMVAEVAGTG